MPRFGTPASADYFKPAEHSGALVLFRKGDYIPDYVFPGSTDPAKPAIKADVYVFDGKTVSKTFIGQTIANEQLVKAIHGAEETYVLGKIVRGTKGNKPWLLSGDFTEDDGAAAEALIDELEGGAPAAPTVTSAVPF